MSTATTAHSRPDEASGGRRSTPGLALAVIAAAQLMVVLDATIVNIALPHIQSALHFSPTGLSWVLNAYTLVFGGLLLLGGRTGDLFGRRRMFIIGVSLFAGRASPAASRRTRACCSRCARCRASAVRSPRRPRSRW